MQYRKISFGTNANGISAEVSLYPPPIYTYVYGQGCDLTSMLLASDSRMTLGFDMSNFCVLACLGNVSPSVIMQHDTCCYPTST